MTQLLHNRLFGLLLMFILIQYAGSKFELTPQAGAACGVIVNSVCIPGRTESLCDSVCGGSGLGACPFNGSAQCACDDGDADPSNDPRVPFPQICDSNGTIIASFASCDPGNAQGASRVCCSTVAECQAPEIAPPTPTINISSCAGPNPDDDTCSSNCRACNASAGRCQNGVCVCDRGTPLVDYCQNIANIDIVDQTVPAYDFCANSSDDEKSLCESCLSEGKGVWSALGCIPTDPQVLVTTLIRFALGIAGGIALLIMLIGVFLLATAAGDPEKQQAAQQTITAPLAGLLIIIFAATILQLIGVDILALPGLLDPPSGGNIRGR